MVGLIAGYLWANRGKIRDRTFFNFSREDMTSGILVLLVGSSLLLVPYLALKNSQIRVEVSEACLDDVASLDAMEDKAVSSDAAGKRRDRNLEITVCGGSADELAKRIIVPTNEVAAVLTAKLRSGTPNRAMRIYAAGPVTRDYAQLGEKRYGVQRITVAGIERLVIQLEAQGTGAKLSPENALIRHSETAKPGKDRCYATTPTVLTFEMFENESVAMAVFWTAPSEKKQPRAVCR